MLLLNKKEIRSKKMNRDFQQLAENDSIYIRHAMSSENKPRDFILHQHTYPEIYIFVSGECSFIYEGNTYDLTPYDIIIVPPNTLHQPIPKINSAYTRYILHPFPSFFTSIGCEFKEFFLNITATTAKISCEKIKETDIVNILYKIFKYSNDLKNINKPIISYLFYEICYILSSIPRQISSTSKNALVQDIINYINENYKYIEALSEISHVLNYSVSHLCMIFKKNVGITIHDYILSKRLNNVEALYKSGETLTSASIHSGFSSYNSFSYAYKKKYKKSPKQSYRD